MGSQSESNGFSALLALVAAASCAAGIAAHGSLEMWPSMLAAAILLLCTALAVSFLCRAFPFSASVSAAFVFIVLATCNVHALLFDTLHIAALLYCLSLASLQDTKKMQSNPGNIAAAGCLLCCSSFFFPPLVWMALPSFFLSLLFAGDKTRHTAAYLAGILLALMVYAGIKYLMGGAPAALTSLSGYASGIVTPAKPTFHITPAAAVRLALTFIGTAASAFFILRDIKRCPKPRYIASADALAFLVCTPVVCLVFGGDFSLPFGLLMSVPASVLIGNFLSQHRLSSVGKALVALFAVVLAIERILLLIN